MNQVAVNVKKRDAVLVGGNRVQSEDFVVKRVGLDEENHCLMGRVCVVRLRKRHPSINRAPLTLHTKGYAQAKFSNLKRVSQVALFNAKLSWKDR